ncbi:MAG TPA: ATP-binding cassette domain-containing protein [Spirochaetota bacterium]|nr:ATP-binding cassette domain-containing protein [Spirochaetota bacterium]
MLKIQNIEKKLGRFSMSLPSLQIAEGRHFVLLGPTGSGKTLLLGMVAGVIKPDAGRVLLNGEDITGVKPEHRGFGMVYQDSALFPHLTVEGNVGFSMKMRKHDREKIKTSVEKVMKQCGISHLFGRDVAHLSGGEKQRVALARAIITRPRMLLLDEPFSSLDFKTREEMMALLISLRKEYNPTILHITHDFEEALILADDVGVIDNGKIIQYGGKSRVFRQPKNAFVAEFVGAKNIFSGTVRGEGAATTFVTDEKVELFLGREVEKSAVGAMIRAEDVILSNTTQSSSATNQVEGTILSLQEKRGVFEVIVDAGIIIHSYITGRSVDELNLQPGNKVFVIFKGSTIHLF